ncbi:MAG TPA: asparagine synthase (glutamine-hydrolyzing) [Steroidobacteraceae bacterium]|nr:asparagine synthase (glutamine-hydrolyzing) [Steroidobacteraceae bacterium]
MCGITGYAGFSDESLLRRMCGRLYHRGPDEDGHFVGPRVGLAMRRLAIIDLKGGKQPISNEAGDVTTVFNGEIYNYQELRADLQQRGHKLATSSDTETIVHLYEDHDLGFVDHLRGMFAIAIWDERKQRLVLARDRIGEKPLYYAWDGRRLLFGSEIKSILPGLKTRNVNPQAVCDFLAAGYVAGETTFYREVSRLPPGHMLIWQDGRIEIKRYWRHDAARKLKLSYAEAEEQLEQQLEDAIRLCLKSDVEVGAFLSGGLDSSTIVALMRRRETKVQTFSVGYRGAATGFNELNYAKRVSEHLGTQHHELILDANSSLELLPKIIWHYDEPHGEPTSVLVYLLCEFVAKRLKVALGGTGGDELFCGYPRHAGVHYLQLYRKLPQFFRRNVVERLFSGIPEGTQGNRLAKRINRFISGAHLPPERAYLSWVNLFSDELRGQLVAQGMRESAADPAGTRFMLDHLVGDDLPPDLIARTTSLDLEGYLPEYQLAYMDRMSMAHSLEVRSPLCDYKLAEFATALPTRYRLKGSRSKHILKMLARKWLPKEIVERKKVGFDSPIGQWFKDDLRGFLGTFLAPQEVARSGMLDPGAVQHVIGEHLAGRKDWSLQLWSIVALEAWHRMYIEDSVEDASNYRVTDLRGVVGDQLPERTRLAMGAR